ncbi:unnamed protein product [Soboliphyme baturini]|uniref:SSD domain-containing protein n=1 Tax=Soboliphyme baturini TaxID=241478 RepID=A0A183IQP1_9BILA|nr:unnamed protein product [Soboliphyme baturini]
MAFFGDFEAQGRHSFFPFMKVAATPAAISKNIPLSVTGVPAEPRPRLSNELSCDQKYISEKTPKAKTNGFFHIYSGLLFNPVIKVGVIVLYLLYISTCIFGCYVIKEGLRPSDLVPRSHSLIRFFHLFERFKAIGQQVHIVVSRPPDFSNNHERTRMFAMVAELESGYHSMGKNSTIIFTNEFLNYLNSLGARIDNSKKMWTEDLHDWMRFTSGRQGWMTDTVWGDPVNGEDPFELKAFRFQIGVTNFDSSLDQMKAAKFFRRVASSYPEFNVTTYHEFWPYIDQYLSVKPTTWRNLALSFVTMIVIAIVLIPNIYCGMFITLSMLSINLGVYGFMALWDVRLDAISMITLIMSIGFAVDLSAHISYGYVIAEGTPPERASVSLELLGYPVFLSGVATLFGVCALSYIDVHMVVTFFKTVFLVILLGLLHSHMFLPIALTILLPKNSHYTNIFQSVSNKFKKYFGPPEKKITPIRL